MIDSRTKLVVRRKGWEDVTKRMSTEIENQLHIAARLAVQEMYNSISVWTGRTAGSLLPAANALSLRLNIQIARGPVSYQGKDGRERLVKIINQIAQGALEGSVFITKNAKPGQKSYTFRIGSIVPYYGRNDNEHVPFLGQNPAASQHWNPTPWNSQHKGLTLLEEEMRERVPKIAQTLLTRSLKSLMSATITEI